MLLILLTNLYYHDIFVTDNQRVSIYCSVSEENAVANGLLVDAVAATGSGQTIINSVITQPAGIIFDALYLSTAASAPAIGSETSALTPITIGTAFTPNGSHNYFVASYEGKAVCVSNDYTNTLPVGD